jgi:hypothetical protein
VTTLEHRDWSVQVGNVRMTPGPPGRSLTVEFEVTKTTDREPNTCTLKVANLIRRRRDSLQELDDPQLQIIAGYRDFTDTIFVGDARDIWSYRDGVDTWTEIESEDGGTAYRTGTIQQSFAAGTPVATVIEACATAMGVGFGNAASVASGAELDSGGNNYANGTTVSGVAWRQLNRVCSSCSLRWSVQNGVLQLRAAGRPSQVSAIVLNPASGLLESPTRGKRDERTGRITYGAKALLIPGLYPGRVVRVQSREVNANLMIQRVRYGGTTTGEDWFAELELQEYTS